MNIANITSFPDSVFVQTETAVESAIATGSPRGGLWERGETKVTLEPTGEARVRVWLESRVPVRRVYLRWNQPFPGGTRFLGDAWERSYGELEWRGIVPNRPLPWYFLAHGTFGTAGYGVATGTGSIASWLVDSQGVTLVLDVRCGGEGVVLGERRLLAAELVRRLPGVEESPFAAAKAFCRELCPDAITPAEPVVGHNDWYWLYGKNSEALILEATEKFVSLYPADATVRPWSVIDDGWQMHTSDAGFVSNGGPWDRTTPLFPDMAALAQKIKALGARPGIWMRPLLTKTLVPDSWKLTCPKPPGEANEGFALDPSVPEVLEQVRTDIRLLRGWGYEMIKHDFSTYDVTGRWGLEMNRVGSMAPDGWSFADRSRTTAEILLDLYHAIREAAGPDVMLIGCNTIGHLAAGLVEIQRIGDDTSASEWDRTRRMGVNTLAFRAPQQGAFFAADADCVPVSPRIPAPLTEAWLDLVARSGTPLFLSIDPAACDENAQAAIRRALAIAAQPADVAEPLDWMDSATPAQWQFSSDQAGASRSYGWSEWSRGIA